MSFPRTPRSDVIVLKSQIRVKIVHKLRETGSLMETRYSRELVFKILLDSDAQNQ